MVSFNLLPEDIVLVEVVAPVEVAPSLSAAWHLFLGLKIHKHWPGLHKEKTGGIWGSIWHVNLESGGI